MINLTKILTQLHGDTKTLGRCITMVENDLEGSNELLKNINTNINIPVIGITGPPGAGKSSLVNAIIHKLLAQKKRIGIIAVDPTSPFNHGSLLGDRIRMAEHFNDPDVFIRSIATRGSLGGLSAKIIEITDVMKAFPFDYIIVETVGVGQSEIEIIGLADATVLVLVPESGDEIQQLKSGIMEIADIFVINKADRPGANTYIKNLFDLLHTNNQESTYNRIIKTEAINNVGIDELIVSINACINNKHSTYKSLLLAEKAYNIIQNQRMKNIDKADLQKQITEASIKPDFNLYNFIEKGKF